jgi:mycobactin peptide synthetase MbtF
MTAAEVETQADIAPDIEDVMALSPLQEGLYSLTALAEFTEGEPADDPYVIGMAADIYGSLDVALLRDCAAKMLVRHPNLRADRAVASRAAVAGDHRRRTGHRGAGSR